jgi:hypothetical protein
MIAPRDKLIKIVSDESQEKIRFILGMENKVSRTDILQQMNKFFGVPKIENAGTDTELSVWKIEPYSFAISKPRDHVLPVRQLVLKEIFVPSIMEKWQTSSKSGVLEIPVGPEDVYTAIKYPSDIFKKSIRVNIKGKLTVTTKPMLMLVAKLHRQNTTLPVEFNLSSLDSGVVKQMCQTPQDIQGVFDALDEIGLLDEVRIKEVVMNNRNLLDQLKIEARESIMRWNKFKPIKESPPLFTVQLGEDSNTESIVITYYSYLLRGSINVAVSGKLSILSITDLRSVLHEDVFFPVDLETIPIGVIQQYIIELKSLADLKPAVDRLSELNIWRPEHVPLITQNPVFFQNIRNYIQTIQQMFGLSPTLKPPDDTSILKIYGPSNLDVLLPLYGSVEELYRVLSQCSDGVQRLFWNPSYLTTRNTNGAYGLDFEHFFLSYVNHPISVFIISLDTSSGGWFESAIESTLSHKYLVTPVSELTDDLPLDVLAKGQVDPSRLKLFIYNPGTSPRDYTRYESGGQSPSVVHPVLDQQLRQKDLYVVVGPISFFEFSTGGKDFLLMGDAHFNVQHSCKHIYPLVPNSKIESVVELLLQTSQVPVHFFLETSGYFEDNVAEFFKSPGHLLNFRIKYQTCWLHNPERSKLVKAGIEGIDDLTKKEDWAYWADCANISNTGQPIYFHYVDYRLLELKEKTIAETLANAKGNTSDEDFESFLKDILDRVSWENIVAKYPTLQFKRESKVWRSFYNSPESVQNDIKSLVTDMLQDNTGHNRTYLLEQLYMDIGTLTRLERVVQPGELVLFYGGALHTELYWKYFKGKADYKEHNVYVEEDPADLVSFSRCAAIYSERSLLPKPQHSTCTHSFSTVSKVANALLDESIMSNPECVKNIFHSLYKYDWRYKQHVSTKLYEDLLYYWKDENGERILGHPSLGKTAQRLLDARVTDPDLLKR